MTIPCYIPSETEQNQFNEITSSLFGLIIYNQSMNVKLSNLRDNLLPKLMSGELDVSELEL